MAFVLALLAAAVLGFALGALCEQVFDVTFRMDRWLGRWLP